MAQLYFEGFELGIPADMSATGTTGAGIGTSSTTAYGYGLCATNGSWTLTKTFPATSDVYIGFRYSASATNAATQVIRLYGDTGLQEHLRLWWSSPTTLSLGRFSTQIATAAVNEPLAGSWAFIEIRATIADTGGRCVVRVDGQTVIDFTGDTKNGGTASTLDSLQFGGAGSGTIRYYDDLYINDATGAAPHNTFYGPCRVYALAPTGAGTDTAFTPSAGANWTCVDEQPASAADFVTASTVGARDTYAMADLPGTVSQVFGVRPTAIAKSNDGAAVNLKTAMRSAGTVYGGTTTPLGAGDSTVATIRSVDPATGAAWTVAAVNAAEAGFEVA